MTARAQGGNKLWNEEYASSFGAMLDSRQNPKMSSFSKVKMAFN